MSAAPLIGGAAHIPNKHSYHTGMQNSEASDICMVNTVCKVVYQSDQALGQQSSSMKPTQSTISQWPKKAVLLGHSLHHLYFLVKGIK